MATQKEKLDALTAELAEEKKATKRARTERDKYKAQVATKGKEIAHFTGHVVLSDGAKLEKGWRRASEASRGGYALHYDDGQTEHYDDLGTAQQKQRHHAYSKSGKSSTLHPTGSSTYVCTYAKGCSEQSFGTVAQGSFTAYAATDDDGKVTAITLIAD